MLSAHHENEQWQARPMAKSAGLKIKRSRVLVLVMLSAHCGTGLLTLFLALIAPTSLRLKEVC